MLNRLTDDNLPMSALNKAVLHAGIAYLARREHSEKELIEKLQRKEFHLSDISPVITYLQENNYQSDERYTESYSRNRVSKGFGWQYIKNALKQQGISQEIVQNQYKSSEIDWYLQAELAYNKRFGSSTIKDQKDKAKRIRFLQYRGFTMDEILEVVNL